MLEGKTKAFFDLKIYLDYFQNLKKKRLPKNLLKSVKKYNFKVEDVPGLILLILIFSIPLIYSNFTSSPFGLTKLLLIISLGLLSLLSFSLIQKFKIKFRGGYLGPFIFALVLVNLFSTLTSQNPYLAFFGTYPNFTDGLFSILTLCGLYFLFINILAKEKVEAMVSGLVFGISLATILTLIQSFSKEVTNLLGLSLGENVLGSVESWRVILLLSLPLSLALSLKAKSKLNKLIGIASLAIGAFTFLVPQTAILIQATASTLSFSETISTVEKIIKAHPLFGAGPANFANAYEMVKSPDTYTKAEAVPFNEFFQKAAVLGGVGIIVYLSLIGSFIKLGLQTFKKAKEGVTYLNLTIFIAALGYFIYQFFSPTNFLVDFYGFILISLLAVALSENATTKVKKTIPLNGYLAGSAILITLAVFYLIGRFYVAEINFTQGSKLKNAGNDQEAANKIETAVSLNPFLDTYKKELGRAKIALALNKTTATGPATPEIEGQLQEGIDLVKEAIKLNPFVKDNYLALTQVYYNLSFANNAYSSQALNSAKEAASLFPTDLGITANLAIIYEETNNYDQAIEIYQKLLSNIPDKTLVYARIASVYEKKQDWTKAIDNWEKVQSLQPSDEIKSKIDELKKKLPENK
ncbi:MAG: tetratricopeptide repeat protein [Patescibacteria group bacterium]|nr:tetratricopeptide repeat protein [Patescibacteria group bacterium]